MIWGLSVDGARMSIAVSNTVIASGSSFIVGVTVESTSTNDILLGESSPDVDFKVLLIDASRRIFQLTRNTFVLNRFLVTHLRPGETRQWTIGVRVDRYYEPPGFRATEKVIPSGKYMLKATRRLASNGKPFDLESNLIKMEIK